MGIDAIGRVRFGPRYDLAVQSGVLGDHPSLFVQDVDLDAQPARIKLAHQRVAPQRQAQLVVDPHVVDARRQVREGQEFARPVLGRVQDGGLEAGVEHRGMQQVAIQRLLEHPRRLDARQGLAVAHVQLADSAEGGAVGVPLFTEHAVDVQGLVDGRAPLADGVHIEDANHAVLGCAVEPAARGAPPAVLANRPVVEFERALDGVEFEPSHLLLVGVEHAGALEFEVLQRTILAGQFPGRRQRGLHVGRTGDDHRTQHVVFLDPGEAVVVPPDLPGRPNGIHPLEHRVRLPTGPVLARGLALVPVGFPDPGILRQVEHGRAGGVTAFPRHIAPDGQGPERLQEALPVVLLARQRRNHLRVGALGGQDFLEGVGQHGVRAQFDETVEPVGQHRADGRREQHRLAEVVPPVRSRQLVALDPGTGDRGVHRNSGVTARDAVQVAKQLFAQGLHVRAVARAVHPEHPREHALPAELDFQLLDQVPAAGEGGGDRAVFRGHPQLVRVFGAQLLRVVLVEGDEHHGPGGVRLLLDRGPPADHLQGGIEVERAGHVRRGDLAHAVPCDAVGNDAPRLP